MAGELTSGGDVALWEGFLTAAWTTSTTTGVVQTIAGAPPLAAPVVLTFEDGTANYEACLLIAATAPATTAATSTAPAYQTQTLTVVRNWGGYSGSTNVAHGVNASVLSIETRADRQVLKTNVQAGADNRLQKLTGGTTTTASGLGVVACTHPDLASLGTLTAALTLVTTKLYAFKVYPPTGVPVTCTGIGFYTTTAASGTFTTTFPYLSDAATLAPIAGTTCTTTATSTPFLTQGVVQVPFPAPVNLTFNGPVNIMLNVNTIGTTYPILGGAGTTGSIALANFPYPVTGTLPESPAARFTTTNSTASTAATAPSTYTFVGGTPLRDVLAFIY